MSTYVILGFRHQADKDCAFLGYYAASSGTRNVDKELPLPAA